MNAFKTYHINDLHERQAEAQLQRIGLVHHWPLQHIVGVQQMVQQTLLVRSTIANYNIYTKTKRINLLYVSTQNIFILMY